MAKVLVLYYSSYGHIERLAQAEAVGARSAGAKVDMWISSECRNSCPTR
jgi:NAD(P)H dehydrogenase (quinone)